MTPIEYTVFLRAPQTQTAEIRMIVRNVAASVLDVALPVWRQGRYGVINPAATIRRFRACGKSGEPLAAAKLDKTTWRVQTGGATEVEIVYGLYANSLADRTRHIDDTHAFLSGATVFLYVPDRRADPVSVHIEAPVDWRVASGLEHAPDDSATLLAASYDVLIDSPIEVGIHDILQFDVEGTPHEIAIWGGAHHDSERLKRDFARIVKAECELFGTIPYDRYIFLIHVGPGLDGGTEHFNSTIMHASPREFEDEENYKKLLRLASHELFHAWNVKRLRPAALRTLDLSKENYTDLLWFCEGTTSYYAELLIVRAGLNNPDAYLKALSDAIHQGRSRPGSRVQSLAESSFDAWIKFNQTTPDDVNSSVSFYDNGALVSLLLDLELRARTANRVSLDTLMREMYRSFPFSGPGFTTADLIQTASRLSDTRFGGFFDKYVHGTEAYPFEDVFDAVGLQLTLARKSEVEPAAKAYIGLNLQDLNGGPVVRSVLSDGPAYSAGVLAGDEIVAVNGRRFSAADLLNYVEQRLTPGDTVQVQVIRRNQLRGIAFELGSKPAGRWQLSHFAAPTPAQKLAYASWLHQPWPE